MYKQEIKPAGGWAALISSNKFLFENGVFKGTKALFWANQKKGFDCPGCAWPEGAHRSFAEFCENGVKAITFETTKKRVTREFFEKNSVSQLNKLDVYTLTNTGRLSEPFYYDAKIDKYKPIGWDDAFNIIANHLKNLKEPDDAIFYTSGRTSNEAAFLYQLMGRMLRTNNFPDCSNMCHESSGVAMSESLGLGKGSVSLSDFQKAELIMIFGQNPGTNHPRMLVSLQKAAQKGTKIVSINPLIEAGLKAFTFPQDVAQMLFNRSTPISSHYYQVKMGSDMALVQSIIKYILENFSDSLDMDFIHQHTNSFDKYKNHILKIDWDELIEKSSLEIEEIAQIAKLYMDSDKTICCWAMGLTQHSHGVATIQEVLNLLLLKGNIGKEGAGACPVRGHSNVQGDRTVGISESPKEEFLQKMDDVFNINSPRKHGVNVIEAIKKMHNEENKVFIGLGGNFADAAPDTHYTHEALKKCALTVHISTHLNKSHLVCGKEALILPCLGRTELDIQKSGVQKVSVEDSMSMVHLSQGRNIPASRNLKSEPEIIAGIANATFGDKKVDFLDLISNYDKIREKIEAVLPIFENFNEKVKAEGGFELYNGPKHRDWKTETKRANFAINHTPDIKIKKGHLLLMSIRSHDQFNTTVYDINDRYRGIKNKRKIIFINPKDMKNQNLKKSDLVNIQSFAKDNIKREVFGFEIIPYNIKEGCVAAYFPEINPLFSVNIYDPKSFTPSYKLVEIKIEKV